jgi:hypothetical protein
VRRDRPPPEFYTADLHPAPIEFYPTDHREANNREQLRHPSELQSIWKRAVEGLAAELCIEPIQAHHMLVDAQYEVTKGLAWAWWLP